MRWYIARHALNLKDCGEAIDLGCGPGLLVITLAKRSTDLRITGVDLSPEMLKQAESYAIESGVEDRVSFKVGNAQEIPFNDHSIDLVVSTLSLHHWKNPIAVMNEIARVLRPGGAYIIFDLRRDMIAPVWLFFWLITHFIVPIPLRKMNEPMSSRDAAYTIHEADRLVGDSVLTHWKIINGASWLMIKGSM
jgi:ubiquinone/menaquinone biosynthesis C-methylase UbiE